ncbi:MAG TPA: DUF6232 family protein [Tepidisphaeraceae bacterium]|nr:DUF6232 family protein [Tepidisphaeraceae bacterium]
MSTAPLNYAGNASTSPNTPPVAFAIGDGIVRLGNVVVPLRNISSVESVVETAGGQAWRLAKFYLLAFFGVPFAIAGTLGTPFMGIVYYLNSGNRDAIGQFVVCVLMMVSGIPMCWRAWKLWKGRRLNYNLIITTNAQEQYGVTMDSVEQCARIREQILQTIVNLGAGGYVDARQVHVHQ